MDLRRPSLAKTLGIKGDTSFASVLEGKADFAKMAVRPRPNVAFGVALIVGAGLFTLWRERKLSS